MEEIILLSEPIVDYSFIEELLEINNDNILILLNKIEYLTAIQFSILVLGISIIILSVIYIMFMKFIR